MPLIESLDAKRLATLKARCALVGIALVESTDDHDRPVYVVSRWAMCKQLDSLAAVEQWLLRVTGKPVHSGATHAQSNIAPLMGEVHAYLVDATASNTDH
jgi:hypothetical protein